MNFPRRLSLFPILGHWCLKLKTPVHSFSLLASLLPHSEISLPGDLNFELINKTGSSHSLLSSPEAKGWVTDEDR